MDMANRIVLTLVLVAGLYHIKRMMTGQVRTGNVLSPKGLQIVRTIVAVFFTPLFTTETLFPHSFPEWLYLQQPSWSRFLGSIIISVALLLRIRAQKTLDDQWSADVSLATKPRLITNGIYSLVRHPIYLAYCLAAPGFLFATGNLAIGALSMLYLGASVLRISLEEKFLRQTFGEEHEQYCARTRGIIIPLPRRK